MTFDEYWNNKRKQLEDLTPREIARATWNDKSEQERSYRVRYNVVRDAIDTKFENEILRSDRDFYYARTMELDSSTSDPEIPSSLRDKMTDRVTDFRDGIMALFDMFE